MMIRILSGLFSVAMILVTGCALHNRPQPVAFTVPITADRVAEGKHLAQLMCASCHYDPATKRLTGSRIKGVPSFVGTVYSRNLTQHLEKGIARYTDGELAFLLRTGLSREGKLMPYMQKPLLADEDLKAVIAFLRSDDELVAPSDVEPPPTRYTLLGRILLRWISSPLPYPTQIVLKPDSEDDLAQGRYLVANLGCYECHSASITGINRMKPEKSKGYMSGGNKLRDAAGHPIYSRNLTFDGTGLKGWSKEDFIKAVKMGVSKNNSVLRYPMPSYAELTDEEAGAIFTYLKSLPPTHHEVKRIVQDQVRGGGPADGLDEQLAPGKQDYEKYASVRLSMGHKRSGVYDFARCRSRARISGVTW